MFFCVCCHTTHTFCLPAALRTLPSHVLRVPSTVYAHYTCTCLHTAPSHARTALGYIPFTSCTFTCTPPTLHGTSLPPRSRRCATSFARLLSRWIACTGSPAVRSVHAIFHHCVHVLTVPHVTPTLFYYRLRFPGYVLASFGWLPVHVLPHRLPALPGLPSYAGSIAVVLDCLVTLDFCVLPTRAPHTPRIFVFLATATALRLRLLISHTHCLPHVAVTLLPTRTCTIFTTVALRGSPVIPFGWLAYAFTHTLRSSWLGVCSPTPTSFTCVSSHTHTFLTLHLLPTLPTGHSDPTAFGSATHGLHTTHAFWFRTFVGSITLRHFVAFGISCVIIPFTRGYTVTLNYTFTYRPLLPSPLPD